MGKKVGVIGGGQLAWMMAQVAPSEDVELWIQTPNYEDSAVRLAKGVVFADIADVSATAQMARICDVITFENEFVDLEGLQKLADKGVCFYPRLSSLAPLLDKYDQRCFLRDNGFPVPHFIAYENLRSFDSFSFPLVLKARRHGYDGQGTIIVNSHDDLKAQLTQFQDTSLLIEEFVPFVKELAVVVGRSTTGEVKIYPVVETYQKNQVCRWVIAPALITTEQLHIIGAIAHKLVTKLDYVGVLAIEMFLTAEGNILVNEIAPRTHNSGHYSLDGCQTSQFALQLQAITGKQLGDVSLRGDGAVMVNLLGYESAQKEYLPQRQSLESLDTFVHWYGKNEAREGRKLGHVTKLITGENPEIVYQEGKLIAEKIESIWYH